MFADLPDPRRETLNKLHRLGDILTLAVCAVIGGAETSDAIAEYGRTKEAFFRRFLELPNGLPSPDTFSRVFARATTLRRSPSGSAAGWPVPAVPPA